MESDVFRILGAIIQGFVLTALVIFSAYHFRLLFQAVRKSDFSESSVLAAIFLLSFPSAVISQSELFPIKVSPCLFAWVVAINVVLVVLRSVLRANRESGAT